MNGGFKAVTRTASILASLQRYESRNVTFIEPGGSWPIVWERALGVHVWDAEGRKYLDLTAAFGVAAAGHANPRVVRAGQRQMAELLHAMGDVHPHALKAELARELSRITFERWATSSQKSKPKAGNAAKTIFCNSGFEAVEAALKTTVLATGKPGIVAFEGAYHGLGYGALNATHRMHFRSPFQSQIGKFGHFVPFPVGSDDLAKVGQSIGRLFHTRRIGAILVEPIQGRGGVNIPPPNFLRLLRRLCDEHDALLVLDEIYTGFGRAGRWFACEHGGVVADLICLGKALTGGFPLSACVGRADVMDAAWPPSLGEAIHTSTFLGHPVGCAMALANIQEIRQQRLVEQSAKLGEMLLKALSALNVGRSALNVQHSKLRVSARGVGLMAGVELSLANGAPATALAVKVIKEMLRRGFILLPEGAASNIISFTPPLTIGEAQLSGAAKALGEVIQEVSSRQ
jgi:4-aminobutyrate aminotransferase-like enzyme